MRKINTFSKLFIVITVLLSFKTRAQNCISTGQYPSGTITISSTGTTNITTCNYAGEYSVDSFTAAGIYSISSVGGTSNYITVTDNSNNPIGAGYSLLGVAIPSTGIYRIHVSTGTACATESACRSVNVWPSAVCTGTVQNPVATVSISSTGTSTLNTCSNGGDYVIASFTAGGSHTLTGTGGTGNFFTVKNAAGTIIYASGASPLVVNIPSSGSYYIHIGTSGPATCGTDATCHVVTIDPPPPIIIPANDLCSNAILMSVPSSSAGTTVNSTNESPSPGTCVTSLSQPGVWYKVVGNGNKFGADLCGTVWDSKLFVYSGSCGAWSCVTGNDDNGPLCSGSAASVTWCSVPSLTYYILVTGYSSANAFTIAVTQTVNSGSNPTVTAVASSNSVCIGSTATLTASGATSYLWNTGSTSTSITSTPSGAITYTVYGRTATCNYDIKTVSVTSVPNTTVSVSANSGSICPGGAFTVSASGATTYSWTGGSGTLTGANVTLSPIVNTIYTVSGTANGCVSSASLSPTVTITTLASPTLVTAANPASICPGFSSTLSVSGAGTYTWASPASNATAVTVSPGSTSIYTVSGTGTNVCNGIRTVTVTVFPQPTITVNSNTLCAGRVFTMTPSGASTYTYSSGSNTVLPTTNTFYTVSGTNAQGCVSATSAVANVTIVPLPVVTAANGTICTGSFYFITPSGASTYSYIGTPSSFVTPTVTTTYSVIGTSSVGCVSLPVAVTVTVYNLPTVTAVASPTDMAICKNQSITFTASGAVTYTWNNSATGSVFTDTPTASTSYSLGGTDANGCVNSANYQVTVNPLPNLALASTPTFVCVNGSASLTASGATTYSWTNNATGASIVVNPSVTTVYGVTGITQFGCTKTLTSTINVNTITLTMSSNTAVCQGKGATVSADAGSNATYTWNTSSPFSVITVTPSSTTTYTVNATDKKFCKHTGMVTVSVNPLPAVTAAPTRTFMCKGESQMLHASGATSYAWSNNLGTGDSVSVTPPFAGPFSYVVTGTDANGCSKSATISLTVDNCTGINQAVSGIKDLRVYPNPNTGLFTIELNNGIAKKIQISDLTGRIVVSEESTDDKTSVNLKDFANGVYYIRIESDKQVEVIKMVKQQ